MSQLPKPVTAIAFMEEGGNDDLERLLKGYASQSADFSYEVVDPDKVPALAEKYAIRTYNTLVVEMGDRQQKVTELTERELTNALLRLVADRDQRVYLSVGHGEAGLGNGEFDLGALEGRLGEYGYTLEDSLFLGAAKEIPADCAVLLIAAPRSPLFAAEAEVVARYLKRGGAVLLLADPAVETGLEGVLEEWGLVLGDDFVVDASGIGSLFGLDYASPVAVSYGDHPIARKHRGVMTVFELARSVEVEPREGVAATELVYSSENAWGETDLAALQEGGAKVQMDEASDRLGPVPMAAVAEKAGGRLVVFGDGDFVTNRFFDAQGNGDLALNAISWLAEDESLISIRPREAGYNPVFLNESQSSGIFWLTVVVLPLAVALLGMVVVSRRGRWSVKELLGAGVGIGLALGIAVLVNFIGGRYHLRYDSTADKLFTLSAHTRELLAGLDRQNRYVKVKAFIGEMEGVAYRELLDEYKYLSGNFDYELIDPQQNAVLVRQYGIRQRGTAIIEVVGEGAVRTERIETLGENALSNGIRRALKAEDHKLYFVAGHGEGDLLQVDEEGFNQLNARLKEMNLKIETGLKLAEGPVPQDATALVVLGPQSPFAEEEISQLRQYLGGGGSVLLLLDPGIDTGLEPLLDAYSVELGQDFIVDVSPLSQAFGADVSVPIAISYGEHPITDELGQGSMSFFPLARSVNLTEHRRLNPYLTPLVFTQPSSWGETDLTPLRGGEGGVELDPDTDRRGPVSLAVAVRADADSSAGPDAKARLVVFGDADFARNQYFDQQANGKLLASAIGWLSEGEDRLAIVDKRPTANMINLLDHEGVLVLWVAVFILPFAVALSGMVIMMRRGYQTYESGAISWMLYTLIGAAAYFFIQSVIGLGEASAGRGQGYMALALLCAAIAYGVQRRADWVWTPALALTAFIALLGFVDIFLPFGFVAVPNETVQLLFVGLFVANVLALLWKRRGLVAAVPAED